MLRNFVFCFISLFLGVYSKELPSFIEVCHRSNSNISECVLHNAIDIIRPKLAEGIPELFIPPFNPLHIPDATLVASNGSYTFDFINISFYNADNFTVEDISDDFITNSNFSVKIHFPEIRTESQYKLKGKLAFLDIDGSGDGRANYSDITAIVKFHTTNCTKEGKTHLKLHTDELELDISKAHFQLDNLFGDNVKLNEHTNDVINENSQDILSELKPVISKSISTFVLVIVNKIYDTYSFDDLFPDS